MKKNLLTAVFSKTFLLMNGFALFLFAQTVSAAAGSGFGGIPSGQTGGSTGGVTTLKTLADFAISLINNYLIPIVFSLALLYFLWGVANYIYKAGDVKARQEGINIMLWGIIGLFVMTSVWGLVNILRDTFVLDEKLPTPQFKIK